MLTQGFSSSLLSHLVSCPAAAAQRSLLGLPVSLGREWEPELLQACPLPPPPPSQQGRLLRGRSA